MKVTIEAGKVHVDEGNPHEIAELAKLMAESGSISKERPTKESSSTSSSSAITREKIPTIEKIKEYIKSQPEYKHSWLELQNRFLGQRLKSGGKTQDVYRFFANRFVLARRQIAEAENGQFKQDGDGFKFVKN